MSNSAVQFEHLKLSDCVKQLASSVSVFTKRLKLQSVKKGSAQRKLVISTNILDLMNFHKGTKVLEDVIGVNEGLVVKRVPDETIGAKQVYSRSYRNRDDETMMDIRSQKKLNEGLGLATHAHIVFTRDEIRITPSYEGEQLAVNESATIRFSDNQPLYSSIFKAIRFIKENRFNDIDIHLDGLKGDSHEAVLFAMQLRRMGYELETIEDGCIRGSIGKAFTEEGPKVSEYTISNIGRPNIKPLKFDLERPLSTFSACTAGVDVFGLESDGWSVDSCMDWRPPEMRDYKKVSDQNGDKMVKFSDKTETGAICAAINAKSPRLIINEDIYKLDLKKIAEHITHANFLQISFACPEFSNFKNKSDKQKAIKTLSSSRDMFFSGLDLIEQINPPVLQVENVANFASSVECDMFEFGLREMGYRIHKAVLNASDYNGQASRNRCFVVATRLEEDFEFPLPVNRTVNFWDELVAPYPDHYRNITHTSSLQKALNSNRLRAVKEGDHLCPSLSKSQSRQAKDSIYIERDGQYYLPDNFILKKIMGLPEEFNLEPFSAEIGSEILGQSVCIKMHSYLANSLKEHIFKYVNRIKQSTSNYFMPKKYEQLSLAI